MARVFPVPAPASTRTGPSIVVAASCCPEFSSSRSIMLGGGPDSEVAFYPTRMHSANPRSRDVQLLRWTVPVKRQIDGLLDGSVGPAFRDKSYILHAVQECRKDARVTSRPRDQSRKKRAPCCRS